MFQGIYPGWPESADSHLSFVVPLLELILGDLASTDEGMARAHSMARRPVAVFGGLWQVIMILRFVSSFAELRLYSVGGRVRIDSGVRSAGMHVRKAGKEEEEAKQAIFPA